MRLIRTIAISAILTICGSPTYAWDHQLQRGLDLYIADDQDVNISLICDPNSVYGTSESAILIQLGVDALETKNLQLQFADGPVVQATLERGRIAKALADDSIWHALIDGFHQNVAFKIYDENGFHSVTLGDPVAFTCR